MIEMIADRTVEKMKERLIESMTATWELFLESLDEFSYIAALYGGAACIIGKVAGSTRAMKYFTALQSFYVLVQGLLA